MYWITALPWSGVRAVLISWAIVPSPSALIKSPNKKGQLSDPMHCFPRSKILLIMAKLSGCFNALLSRLPNSSINVSSSFMKAGELNWLLESCHGLADDVSRIANKVFPKSSNEIPRRDPFTPFLVPTRVKYSRAAMLRSICILFSCSIDSNVPRTRLLS